VRRFKDLMINGPVSENQGFKSDFTDELLEERISLNKDMQIDVLISTQV
jgi:hypothetical protein